MHSLLAILSVLFISLTETCAAEFCDSTPCKHESSRLLLTMKHNADPCEEFHELVCGGRSILADTTNLKHYQEVKQFLKKNSMLAAQLSSYKTFLEVCENYNHEFEFKENMLKLLTHKDDGDVTELLISLILTQSSPLFDIGIDIDVNQNYQLQLIVPSAKSPLRTALTGWTVEEIIRNACTEYVQSTITETEIDIDGLYQAFANCLRETLEYHFANFQKEASYFKSPTLNVHILNTDGLLEFLNSIQEIRPSPNEIRQNHLYKSIDPLSINELKRKYDLVDWKKLFDSVVPEGAFRGDDIVEMAFPKYFDDLFKLLRTYDKLTLRRLLQAYHAFQLYLNVAIPQSEKSDIFCFNIANELMPAVATTIAYSLVPKTMTTLWNNKFKLMFEGLRLIFDRSIEESKMDEVSKQLLRDKLKKISLESATFENNYEVEVTMKDVQFGSDFLKNLLDLLVQYRKSVLSLVGKQATPTSILTNFVSAFDGRPKGYQTIPFIVFHPSALAKSLLDIPEYIVYTQIGMHLAKELARHFDGTGRKHFTSPDISSSDQFYKYIADQTNTFVTNFFLKDSYTFMGNTYSYQNINITLLLDELISDNAAFRLVHDYIKENTNIQSIPWASQSYNNDQLFFIIAAQQYCWETTDVSFTLDILESRNLPSPLKIQNIVSNSEEFSEAFSCPEGSAMRLDSSVITQFPRVEYYGDYNEE
ncbi:unnamed protein product [Callosobruchus maculatus]|uniref:Peptidase M13 N-terminal domain-containing protein n=1 Tax=Callosobruchus maculatus TaxID=64391 RepID=A0A653BXD7_CALMS|nr:unnamed protein product [Callosobruchus maculatus]